MDSESRISTTGPVEYRVFGPPGCGKTTWLQRQVENAVEKHGRESVMVTSLTHAAKEAAIRKGLPIPDSAVGTLHSLARRAVGESTELAFKRGVLDTWNTAHRSWLITPSRRGEAAEDIGDDSDEGSGKLPGDLILEEVSALRCRMVPTESWPVGLRAFFSAWSDWKNEMGVIDFTDMIERALVGTDHAPGCPRFIFCDEAQDMDRLQLELVRKWAAQCEKLILIGDPDQNLYEFRGTDSTNFMNPPIPKERQMILSQSYRVPAAVHSVAVRWVRRIKKRIDAEYKPTKVPGSASSLDCPFRRPDDLIPEIVKRLDAGKRVMLLASCYYMLTPTIGLLRANGIPFHNEYSDRGAFNPLKNAKSVMGYLSTDEELHGADRRLWTWKELRQWTDYLRSEGILQHGAKADIKRRAAIDGDKLTTMGELRGLFIEGAVKLDNLGWLDRNQTKGAPKNLRYMSNIAQKRGKKALVEEPRLSVGTIHSVKGGESDCVFLFLSLFSEEFENYSVKSTRGYDSIIRKFYVAMTRAREELVLLEQSDLSSIEVSDVL